MKLGFQIINVLVKKRISCSIEFLFIEMIFESKSISL